MVTQGILIYILKTIANILPSIIPVFSFVWEGFGVLTFMSAFQCMKEEMKEGFKEVIYLRF